MDIHESTSEWYRIFCRVICPGLILLGLFLLAISYRTSQFTCQRSSGQCEITHPGILPAPKITFGLGYLGRALIEHTDQCCSSDDPIWYNMTIEAGGINQSYRLLFAWVSRETADVLLNPAADKVNQFLRDPNIAEVTVRLPDHRREDFICGIFFLIVGTVYTMINARIIFSRRAVASTALDSWVVEPVWKKKLFWHPVFIWLWWSFIPWLSVIVFIQAVNGLYSLPIHFALSWGWLGKYQALFDGVVWPILATISTLLAYYIAQGWVIHRIGIHRFGCWTVVCTFSTFFLMALLWFLPFYYNQENFFSLAYSQGRLSSFGLAFGSFVGIFQWLMLRTRLFYARWWILFSALISEGFVLVPQVVTALFPRVPFSLELTNDWISLQNLGFLWCFSALQGAVLIWMTLKNPAVQTITIS